MESPLDVAVASNRLIDQSEAMLPLSWLVNQTLGSIFNIKWNALCIYSLMKIRLTKAHSTMRSFNAHETGKLRPFLSRPFFRVISKWSKLELLIRNVYPTFAMQSRCIYSENVAHRVNAMSVINVSSIFTGSVFVRIADTKYIRAMARPWSKLTERWVPLERQ